MTTTWSDRTRWLSLLSGLLLLTPLLVAAAILFPRVRSAQFGLLDDGVTIAMARQINAGQWLPIWEVGSGRSRPMYWLFNYATYALVGANPRLFFLVGGILFIGIAGSLIWVVRAIGGSRWQAWATGMFFVLSGAAIENLYTLSKPEPQQTAWMVVSLVVLILLYRGRVRWHRAVAFVAQCLVLSVAGLTKETSLAIVPISMVWFGGSLRLWPGPEARSKRLALGAYAAAALAGALVFFALRSVYSKPGEAVATYSTGYVISLSRFVESAVRWSGWLIRDYLYLVPLALLWFGLSISRRRILGRDVVAASLVWMGAWFAVYLPWRTAHEYYLLPFAMGAAVMSAWMTGHAVQEIAIRRGVWRWLIAACLAVSGVLFMTLQVNDLANARLQLAVDEANGETLSRLAATLPPGATLLVNIQAPSEYIDEITLQVPELYGRPDVIVQAFAPGEKPAGSIKPAAALVMSPIVENLPLLKTRGPGAGEDSAKLWDQTMRAALAGSLTPIFDVERSYRLTVIDLPRLFCPLMSHKGYCQTQSPILDLSTLRYGWQVYQIAP